MATRSLDIIIGGRNNLGPLTASVRGSLNSIASVATTVRNAVVGMLAPLAAGFTLGKIFEQAAEAEKVVAQLAASLNLIGKGGASAVRDMQEFATSIQRVTTLGDEAVLQIATIGVNLGKFSGQQLKDATTAAIGLSRRLGIDAPDAMKLLAKAAAGNTTALSRYGIVLKDTMTAQEKFDAVLKIGTESFSLATAETETAAGKWTQLKEVIGDFAETIGSILTPVVIPAMEGATKALIDFAEKFKAEFITLEFVFRNWGDLVQLIMTSNVLAWVQFYNTIEYAVGVAMQFIRWFIDNAINAFKSLWDYVKTVTENIAENLFNLFSAVQSWLAGNGFDFKWTALAEGFKATLTELPQILEREKGPIEKSLETVVEGLKKNLFGNLEEFVRGKLKGLSLPSGLPERTTVPDSDKTKAKGKVDTTPTASLVSSQFITGSITRDPSIAVQQQTAKNTAEMQKQLVDSNRKQAEANRTLADMYRLMLKPQSSSSLLQF